MGVGLASLNNFRGPGADRLTLVVWHLALGDEGRRIVAHSGEPNRGVVWGGGSGLVGMHMKSTLPGQWLTVSRNWGWGSLSINKNPTRSKHQKYRKFKFCINTSVEGAQRPIFRVCLLLFKLDRLLFKVASPPARQTGS